MYEAGIKDRQQRTTRHTDALKIELDRIDALRKSFLVEEAKLKADAILLAQAAKKDRAARVDRRSKARDALFAKRAK